MFSLFRWTSDTVYVNKIKLKGENISIKKYSDQVTMALK